jgi:hypothetical protein
MKQFKFSKETSMASLVLLAVYAVYGAFRIPYIQFFVCLLAGAIAYMMTKSYEIALIGLLVVNFVSGFVSLCATKSGFVDGPKEISGRVKGFLTPGVGTVQGFANADDVSGNEMTAETEDAVATKESVPATVDNKPKKAGKAEKTGGGDKAEGTEKANKADGFEGDKGLFKLGAIPSDGAGGLHIDAGSTVMNALKALKPDQIQAMTQDTKQLLETQKNLMEMLKTFSPMMQEGKQMMDTFNGMFGGSSGANNVA